MILLTILTALLVSLIKLYFYMNIKSRDRFQYCSLNVKQNISTLVIWLEWRHSDVKAFTLFTNSLAQVVNNAILKNFMLTMLANKLFYFSHFHFTISKQFFLYLPNKMTTPNSNGCFLGFKYHLICWNIRSFKNHYLLQVFSEIRFNMQ